MDSRVVFLSRKTLNKCAANIQRVNAKKKRLSEYHTLTAQKLGVMTTRWEERCNPTRDVMSCNSKSWPSDILQYIKGELSDVETIVSQDTDSQRLSPDGTLPENTTLIVLPTLLASDLGNDNRMNTTAIQQATMVYNCLTRMSSLTRAIAPGTHLQRALQMHRAENREGVASAAHAHDRRRCRRYFPHGEEPVTKLHAQACKPSSYNQRVYVWNDERCGIVNIREVVTYDCNDPIQEAVCKVVGMTQGYRFDKKKKQCVAYKHKCDQSPNSFGSMEKCQSKCESNGNTQ
ncbi:hypothetical protein CLF_110094 [Clonorchis sinensis]|uniref:BPTI/Kunitz inhibitor domain-containing protein n=1 Tax=Clonorchis sinensis TaxID=79923 RepID=G7YK91_CLOSI|nr:hypothetical protein CLF_110094 [Clonorchis sinensis]